jgi:hypothetical protein
MKPHTFIYASLLAALALPAMAETVLPKGSLVCDSDSLTRLIGEGDYRSIRDCRVSKKDMKVEVVSTTGGGGAEVFEPLSRARLYVQREALK